MASWSGVHQLSLLDTKDLTLRKHWTLALWYLLQYPPALHYTKEDLGNQCMTSSIYYRFFNHTSIHLAPSLSKDYHTVTIVGLCNQKLLFVMYLQPKIGLARTPIVCWSGSHSQIRVPTLFVMELQPKIGLARKSIALLNLIPLSNKGSHNQLRTNTNLEMRPITINIVDQTSKQYLWLQYFFPMCVSKRWWLFGVQLPQQLP